jgi:hypothetical protein
MEELIELKTYIEQKRYDDALRLINELEEMSKDDKINKIDSFSVVLLIHLIKQEVEKRSTRSWEFSIRNAVREIRKTNKRRKAGGYYLTGGEIMDILSDAWDAAVDRAALEAFEGQHDSKWICERVNREEIIQKAYNLLY